MALITHHMQGSCGAFPSRSLSWTDGTKLGQFARTVHMVNRSKSSKSSFLLRLVVPQLHRSNVKPLKISAFKGSAQSGDSGGKARRSKFPKKSFELSHVSQESEESEKDSSEVKNVQHLYTSEVSQTNTGSAAIHNLLNKWLTMLHTQSPVDEADDNSSAEELQLKDDLQMQTRSHRPENRGLWMAIWSCLRALDATVKIPLLIFIPGYVAVSVYYGADVSKELMPLWVFGPLIAALYIKLLQGICALYVFCFKQTVKVVRNLPAYSLFAYGYIAQGKLKEDIRTHLWKPVEDIKNLDYGELLKKKLKILQEYAVEKYLDYVESIWPYYCQIIRFLKTAKLI